MRFLMGSNRNGLYEMAISDKGLMPYLQSMSLFRVESWMENGPHNYARKMAFLKN